MSLYKNPVIKKCIVYLPLIMKKTYSITLYKTKKQNHTTLNLTRMDRSDKDFNRKILIITFNFARAQEIKAFTEGRGRFQGLLFSGHKFFHATSIALDRAGLYYVYGVRILCWDHFYLIPKY